MSNPVLATETKVPAARLGGPGSPDPALCSAQAIAVLAQAAGPDMRMTSLALDVASHALGEGMVEIAAKIDKRAKSIVFASVEARVGASMVFSAQGLFSRVR
jgi:hypothetical protein